MKWLAWAIWIDPMYILCLQRQVFRSKREATEWIESERKSAAKFTCGILKSGVVKMRDKK